MDEKDTNQSVTDEEAMAVFETDEKEFNNFVDGKQETIDFARIQRLILSELNLNKNITPQTICGITRQQIKNMAYHPEMYGDKILALMDVMYQKSGYLRRLIKYFCDMPTLRYYVDTEALTSGYLTANVKTLRSNYIKFCAQASKFNLSSVIHDIFWHLYMHDVCYAYVIENDDDISYFFLDPRFCKITSIVNGNIFGYAINRALLTDVYIQTLPSELQTLLNTAAETSPNNLVEVPYENGFCVKYNNNFLHLFPALYPMIQDILELEDYEDLAKTKAINDAYKLLILHVPTKDGKITMGDKLIAPFIQTALNVVNSNIGVLPYPGDVTDIEFSSSNADDEDMVANVTTQMYAAQGVSESLMSGASSGSELKLSITNDSGDIFRVYRMLENWISLQMKLRGFMYSSYQFVYRLADMTIFNTDEVIDEELKLAQASLPNKAKLCAVAGISPNAVLGNSIMENTVFKDIYDSFLPLKSSYTTSGATLEGEETSVGAPEKDDDDLSVEGEASRDNDANDPDNRV